MTNNHNLKEYEVLSEDRRRAIEIFIKGIMVGGAVITLVLKYFMDSIDLAKNMILGTFGFIVILFYHAIVWRCRKHDFQLNKCLNNIAEEYGFQSVISTRYIFNIVWIGGTIVTIFWVMLLAYSFVKLATRL